MFDVADYITEQTGDILVSAYHELLNRDTAKNELWAYLLRIENNSGERIRLLKKDFCLTDERGNNRFFRGQGFNGELPDLEPGECYEFEDTAEINGTAAVLYGFCSAVTQKGKELKIKLPPMTLSSDKSCAERVVC